MKSKSLIFIISLLVVVGICSQNIYSQKEQKNKVLDELMKKANRMTNKGALSVVGQAVMLETRSDMGTKSAREDAKKQMTEMSGVWVEATSNKVAQAVGVDEDAEFIDVIHEVCKSAARNYLQSGKDYDYGNWQTKAQRKAKKGQRSYYVLYYIDPESIFQSLENEMQKNKKAKEKNLYQRYRASELLKTHEDDMKNWEEFQKQNED